MREERRMAEGSRSPSTFPPFSIEQAIERTQKVWQTIRNTTASDLMIAQSMGHQSLNGTSRSSIAGLKKYGLLEPVGKEKLRLSDDAKAVVVLPQDDPLYAEAIWRIALNPPLFAELHDNYGFDLPDDRSLHFYLVGKRFTPEAARDAIRTYRETLLFLEHVSPRDDLHGNRREQTAQSTKPSVSSASTGTLPAYEASVELHVPLFGGCKAHLIFEGEVTRRSLQKLSRYLELFAEDYMEDLSLVPAQQPSGGDRAYGEVLAPPYSAQTRGSKSGTDE